VYRKKEKEWQLKVKLSVEIGLKRELHEEVQRLVAGVDSPTKKGSIKSCKEKVKNYCHKKKKVDEKTTYTR
jgi:hypothetical protein